MATFHSYELNGKKLSFANWVSNLSPEDTPFVSSTGKESIDQTKFTWQTDKLDKVNPDNAVGEGSDATVVTLSPTKEISNQTQILRKVVKVSDTANATANYGRGRELQYQMEKASKSIKRDLEAVLLTNKNQRVDTTSATADQVRRTGGFRALVGETGTNREVNTLIVGSGAATHTGTQPDVDSGAVVVKSVQAGVAATDPKQPFVYTDAAGVKAFEAALFDLTANLYLAGAKADTILVHPSLAPLFTALQEKEGTAGATRVRYFENTKTIDLQVSQITDPLGQTFKVVYDRFMPIDRAAATAPAIGDVEGMPVFIYSTSDWQQMVMRAPERINLAKNGSAETYMIEMEIGLRHRNPYASGVLTVAEI